VRRIAGVVAIVVGCGGAPFADAGDAGAGDVDQVDAGDAAGDVVELDQVDASADAGGDEEHDAAGDRARDVAELDAGDAGDVAELCCAVTCGTNYYWIACHLAGCTGELQGATCAWQSCAGHVDTCH
jgi:hypothetical protein